MTTKWIIWKRSKHFCRSIECVSHATMYAFSVNAAESNSQTIHTRRDTMWLLCVWCYVSSAVSAANWIRCASEWIYTVIVFVESYLLVGPFHSKHMPPKPADWNFNPIEPLWNERICLWAIAHVNKTHFPVYSQRFSSIRLRRKAPLFLSLSLCSYVCVYLFVTSHFCYCSSVEREWENGFGFKHHIQQYHITHQN